MTSPTLLRSARSVAVRLALCAALLILAGLASAAPALAATPVERLVNGGFEQGTTATGCFGPMVDASLVDGWETTDPQNDLEYWVTDAGNCAGFSTGAPQTAYEGTYWNELNAWSEGTGLYQDIITVPGTTIRWTVAHRARGSASTDVMQVILGAGCGDGQNGLTALVPDTYNNNPTGRDPQTGSTLLSDGSGGWGVWSGEYTVPAGQWFTRISFNGVSTSLGSGAGNFIDAVSVTGQVPPAGVQQCQPLLKITTTSGRYGNPLTLATAGGLGSGEVTYVVDSGPCTVESGVLIATGAGDCYLTATKASDGNNPETASDSTKITIAKARPLCTVVGYNVTYTGTQRTATGTCVGVEGDGELTGLSLTGTRHTNAGTYNGDSWTFTDTSGDYQDASGTVNNVIVKAAPTCVVVGYAVTYTGAQQTAAGSCRGVPADGVLSGLVLTGTRHTNAGTYNGDAWAFTDVTGNYADASGTVDNVIRKAAPTCAIVPLDVVYDGSEHGAGGSCRGVPADGVLSGLVLTGTRHTNAGTYNGDAWAFTDVTGNYADASGTVDGIIRKAVPDCSIVPYSVTYDATEQVAEGACLGVDDLPLIGLDLTDTEHTNAGRYTGDEWTFTDVSGNYRNRSGTMTNVIAKAWPECDITPYSVTYDETEHTATGTCTGVGTDGELTGLVLTDTAHTDAGTYANDAWTFTDVTGNYRDRTGKILDLIEKAEQAALTVDQTEGITDYPLPITTSGGSGNGDVSYHVETGACRIDKKGRLRASEPGECTVEATKAGDRNHLPTTVIATITFIGQGITSITLVTTSIEKEYAQTPGGTVHFLYDVHNDGDVPIPGPVTIDDPVAADAACPDLTTIGDFDDHLDPGETTVCTGSHVVDTSDVRSGRIARTVTASAGDEDVWAEASVEASLRVAPTILVILDRSGSQGTAASRTIGRYNRVLADWKSKTDLAAFHLTLFSTDGIERRYRGREIDTVPRLTPETFRPGGATDLYDVVALEIRRLRASDPIGRVTVVIITDGVDTASTVETRRSVADLIDRMKRRYGWSFGYAGASIATMRSAPAEAAGPIG